MSRDVLSPEDREVVDLYYDDLSLRNGHAYHVVAAFVLAGIEPPHGNQGYTARQSEIIQAHYDKYDPHGSRAHAAKIKAEIEESD